MLEKIFQELSFSSNEVKIYLLLAEVGKSTAQLLAKRAKIPRTTAYSVLESLRAKGLISEEKKQSTTFFVVNKPTAFLRLIKQEQEDLKKKESLVKDLLPLLDPYFKSKHFSIPRIQFFEGKASVEGMLYDSLDEWRRSAERYDFCWWGYQDAGFVEQYIEWLEYYWSVKSPKEELHLLSNKNVFEERLKGRIPGRTIKLVPESFDFSSSIWVVGDYIVLLMTRQEPHYAFQLRDPVFGQNLRLIYKLLWGFL